LYSGQKVELFLKMFCSISLVACCKCENTLKRHLHRAKEIDSLEELILCAYHKQVWIILIYYWSYLTVFFFSQCMRFLQARCWLPSTATSVSCMISAGPETTGASCLPPLMAPSGKWSTCTSYIPCLGRINMEPRLDYADA
jgi:hypothetical protein